MEFDLSGEECKKLLDIINIFFSYSKIKQDILDRFVFNSIVNTRIDFCPNIIKRLLDVWANPYFYIGTYKLNYFVLSLLIFPEKLIPLLEHGAETKSIVDLRFSDERFYHDDDELWVYTHFLFMDLMLIYGSDANLWLWC